LLEVENIGINDSFFDLGGHSLLAIKTLSRIRDQFEVNIQMGVLFERPTVLELADAIDALMWLESPGQSNEASWNREELEL
jgi:nonribosomal peptide synthetase DhbF